MAALRAADQTACTPRQPPKTRIRARAAREKRFFSAGRQAAFHAAAPFGPSINLLRRVLRSRVGAHCSMHAWPSQRKVARDPAGRWPRNWAYRPRRRPLARRAERMARHRGPVAEKGLRCINILFRESDIDMLIRRGRLYRDDRANPTAVRRALRGFLDDHLRGDARQGAEDRR